MKKNLKNSINDFFSREPSLEQKSWNIINQFYHMVLTKMEKDNISRADLARKLGKSRASISQMFNKTPNLTIKKMIEIANAIDLEINLSAEMFVNRQNSKSNTFILVTNNYGEERIKNNALEISSIEPNKHSTYIVNYNDYLN